MEAAKQIKGVVFDPIKKKQIPGIISILNGRILKIEEDLSVKGPLILPGLVDSHIHIESSMLVPAEFSKIAKKHGTVAVIADPHEIANVAGVEGINFMIDNAKNAEIKFFFGAPSCVPASPFDSCFDVLDSRKIESLLSRDDIHFLGEMMNFPGVVNSDPDVINKINSAIKFGKPVDGHAPGLSGESLRKYVDSGISTDHECFSLDEAIEKIKLGMKILIREGSAAKNFDSLHPLVKQYPEYTMFCTDDCHPEDLIEGHINRLVKRALSLGYDIFDILQVISVNPIKHFHVEVGLLQEGDSADFIVVDKLTNFNILQNYINGVDVLAGDSQVPYNNQSKNEYVFANKIDKESIKLPPHGNTIRAIRIIEGELITEEEEYTPIVKENNIISDVDNDFLKIVVVSRYNANDFSVGFIKGFGIKNGAIAESIAHDSHHIIAVGVDDASIYNALKFVIENKGGLCYYDGKALFGLALPIYGLIAKGGAGDVAKQYKSINEKVINDGCIIKAPFMTLSFMALSVIPKLKITPYGLFDVIKFNFVDQFK